MAGLMIRQSASGGSSGDSTSPETDTADTMIAVQT